MGKQTVFEPIPVFDEQRQAVIQLAPVDKGDYLLVRNKVIDLPEPVKVDEAQESVKIGEEVYLRPIELPIYERVNNLEKENAQLKAELAEIKESPTVKSDLIALKEPVEPVTKK